MGLKVMEPDDHGLELLKPPIKINSSFQLFLLGICHSNGKISYILNFASGRYLNNPSLAFFPSCHMMLKWVWVLAKGHLE
jgi:hypothetical protein